MSLSREQIEGIRKWAITEKRPHIRELADIVLRSLDPAPSGWQSVPREPTEAMVRAFIASDMKEGADPDYRQVEQGGTYGEATWEYLARILKVQSRYKAMLSAAPQPPVAQGWMPIESAPKSTYTATKHGADVHGIYILGYCPEPDMCNLESGICVVWWEPLMKKGKGMWYGEGGWEVHPTHWQSLPAPPQEKK